MAAPLDLSYPESTVWFIAASSSGHPTSQGTAVAIRLRRKGGSGPSKTYLLTCAHVIRQTGRKTNAFGPCHESIHVWPPGGGYNPRNGIPVEPVPSILPIESTFPDTFYSSSINDIPNADWVLLSFVEEDKSLAQDTPVVRVWNELRLRRGDECKIIGYPGGDEAFSGHGRANRDVVMPMLPYGEIKVAASGNGIIQFNGSNARPGMSGGAVFGPDSSFVGLHRERDDPMQQLHAVSALQIRAVVEDHDLVIPPVSDDDPPSGSAVPVVNISSLPSMSRYFFGREAEIMILNETWKSPNHNVISIVGWGGTGKTALVTQWLRNISSVNYDGARYVFAWSFFGDGDSVVAKVDLFLSVALAFFEYPSPSRGSPIQRARRLSKYLAENRTLLVLDALETLQRPPGPDEGSISNEPMRMLLRSAAETNPGLCVLTSRQPVSDLADYELVKVKSLVLGSLTAESGRQLIARLGVRGNDNALDAVVSKVKGHPLSLLLLSGYLVDVFDGEVGEGPLTASLVDDVHYGKHATQVMASYESWFGDSLEVDILRLLSLFDRPADSDSVGVLRRAPPIPGLTYRIVAATPAQWHQALAKLRRAHLLAPKRELADDFFDTHALVREYFRRWLDLHGEAYLQAKKRLFAHLRERLQVAIPEGQLKGHASLDLHELYVRTLDLAEQIGRHDDLFAVFWGLWASNLVKGELSTALDFAEKLVSVAEDDGLRAESMHSLGDTFCYLGRFAEGTALFDKALAMPRSELPKGEEWPWLVNTHINTLLESGPPLFYIGRLDQAVQRCSDALTESRQASHAFSITKSLLWLSWVRLLRGETSLARELTTEAKLLAQEKRFQLWDTAALVMEGWCDLHEHKYQHGVDCIHAALANWELLGAGVSVPMFCWLLGRGLFSLGKHDEALIAIERGYQKASVTSDVSYIAPLMTIKAEIFHHLNRITEARLCASQAIDIALSQHARTWELAARLVQTKFATNDDERRVATAGLAECFNSLSEGRTTQLLSGVAAQLQTTS